LGRSLEFIKLVWKKIRHSVTNPRPLPFYSLNRRPSLLLSLLNGHPCNYVVYHLAS
jgi:hypothetical protein